MKRVFTENTEQHRARGRRFNDRAQGVVLVSAHVGFHLQTFSLF